MKRIVLTALASSALTAVTIFQLFGAPPAAKIALENAHVKVSEITYPAGAVRPRSIRPANEVIVFLDGCRYERTDPKTGAKTIRQRKSGEVIWHNKGEDAPVLRSLTSNSYREIVVELK
ncbi:MAG: hypothetical protein ACREH9_09130 [Pseudomonadota bacterium]